MILLAFVPFKVYNKSNFRGRLIHRNINKWGFLPPKIGVDLYTSSTYTPENTVQQAIAVLNVMIPHKHTWSFTSCTLQNLTDNLHR